MGPARQSLRERGRCHVASLLARPTHEWSARKGKEGAGDAGPSHDCWAARRERSRPSGRKERGQTGANRGPEGKGFLIFFSKLFFLILFQMGFEFI